MDNSRVLVSRTKREGKYRGCRFGKHFHSTNALCNFMRQKYPNPWDHIKAGFKKNVR